MVSEVFCMAGHTVVVLGGGIGGVVAASVLRRELLPEDRVVLVDRSAEHTFAPSLLWVLTGARTGAQVCRGLDGLGRRGIEVLRGAVTEIDPERRTVVAGGERLAADALVVALGADLDPERVPGLATAGNLFYTLEGAERLRDQVATVERGQVAVVIAAVPFKCPAAPYEAAMLIDHVLRRRRVRDRVTVSVYAAEPGPMGVAGPEVSRGVVALLDQRGIDYHPGVQLASVDAPGATLTFADGSLARYDILAAVAPHQAPAVVRDSPLAGPAGWIPVDAATCETRFPGVFAIGDVTSIPLTMGKPLPKAGVFARAQAEVVAHTIAARLRGRGQERRFDGEGACFVEIGGGAAGFARGNFYAEPAPRVRLYRPGRHWHAAKLAFERDWWKTWFR